MYRKIQAYPGAFVGGEDKTPVLPLVMPRNWPDWVVYFCTVCNIAIADPRGWPAHDCNNCGAGPELLTEEKKPTSDQLKVLAA